MGFFLQIPGIKSLFQGIVLVIQLIGVEFLVGGIGFIVFLFCYRYSQVIFDFIEKQTFGTQVFVQDKLKLLFIDIEPKKITYTLLLCSVGIGLFTFFAIAIVGSWFLAIIFGLIVTFIGFKIPKPIMNFLVAKRVKKYESQMVDALTLLANGLRAGRSVPQSIAMVVDEMPAPISEEFNLILKQNQIGTPLEECLSNLAIRVPVEDNEMFVSSVNIIRETGGNLSEIFDTIVSVIRERIRLKQKIDTFIAQGLWQGGAIFSMPFVLGLIFTVSNPEQMSSMVTKPLGIIFLLMAFGLDLLGGYVILRIVRIKV